MSVCAMFALWDQGTVVEGSENRKEESGYAEAGNFAVMGVVILLFRSIFLVVVPNSAVPLYEMPTFRVSGFGFCANEAPPWGSAAPAL